MSSDFQGVNEAYVLEQYEKYQRDPTSVDPATRAFFEGWTPPGPAGPEPRTQNLEPGARDASVLVGAINLAQSIRLYGHLAAQIDPLGSRPSGDPLLRPEAHGV